MLNNCLMSLLIEDLYAADSGTNRKVVNSGFAVALIIDFNRVKVLLRVGDAPVAAGKLFVKAENLALANQIDIH